jgi:hypothetical protein
LRLSFTIIKLYGDDTQIRIQIHYVTELQHEILQKKINKNEDGSKKKKLKKKKIKKIKKKKLKKKIKKIKKKKLKI